MRSLKAKPLFSRFIDALEEDTEDLYDVIENLVFSNSREFRSLLGDCVQHLSTSDSLEPVGHLY
jgi:hypothetical protein